MAPIEFRITEYTVFCYQTTAEFEDESYTRTETRERRVILMKASGVNIPMEIDMVDANRVVAGMKDNMVDEQDPVYFIRELIASSGASIKRVAITELRDDKFRAAVVVRKWCKNTSMPLYPIDAILLALLAGLPVFISQEVIIQATSDDNSLELIQMVQEWTPSST
jgi:bifunctional DNase/RNase